MATTQIPATLIATSLPLNIANASAIPYFPGFVINFAASSSGTIFSVAPTILVWNFQADANWTFFAGLAGPAIALDFTASGEYDANRIALNVGRNEIQGGILFGVNVGLGAEFAIRQASLHWVKNGWHSHLETTWNTKLNVNASVTFDLISLILGIVTKIFEEDGKDTILRQVNNFNSNLLGSYGIFDDVTNGFQANQLFSVNPSFSLPLNVVPFIPGLRQINEGLEALMGGLFLGPTIGFAIPAAVHINSLEIDGSTYTIDNRNGSALSGGRTGSSQTAADTLKVNMDRSPGLDITLGIGANVSVLKLFSLGGSITIDVLGLLGIRPNLGTFPFSLSNSVGSSVLSEVDTEALEMAEVILEWPVA